MLSNEQISSWQKLVAILSSLPTDSTQAIASQLRSAIELFESQILTQSLDPLPDPIAAKMRSYVTESHRLLRLLPMDLMFITAARNPTTIEQRRQAYQSKLDLLLQYCLAVVGDSGQWTVDSE
jgi:hypothetical protein